MNREAIEVYLAEYVDGTLPESARAEIERALLRDPQLAAEVELARFGREAASRLAPPSMPFELRGRILSATVERPRLLGRLAEWFRAMPSAVYAAAMIAVIAGVVALVEVETMTHGGVKTVEPAGKVTAAIKGVSMVKEKPAAAPVAAVREEAKARDLSTKADAAESVAMEATAGDDASDDKDQPAKVDELKEESAAAPDEGLEFGPESAALAESAGAGRMAERGPPSAPKPSLDKNLEPELLAEADMPDAAPADAMREYPAMAPMEELTLPVTVVTTRGGYAEDSWDVAPYIVDDTVDANLAVAGEAEAMDEVSEDNEYRNGPALIGAADAVASAPAPSVTPLSLTSVSKRGMNRQAPARERSDREKASKKTETAGFAGGKADLSDAGSADGGAIHAQVVARYAGAYSGWTRPGRVVIRDEATWEQYWRTINAVVADPPPAPTVDFHRQIVIGIGLGSRPTGGFGVDIVSVRAAGSRVLVRVSSFEPEPGQLVTQAFTQPYALVVVDVGEAVSPEDVRVGFER